MPTHAHPVDVLTHDLVAVYARGQARLEELIAAGLHRGLDPSRLGQETQRVGDATQAYRTRQLAQARAILEELRTQGARAGALAVGRAYGAGLVSVDRLLGRAPDAAQGIAGRFGRIHTGQVEVLAANLTASLDAAAARMGANLELVFARAGELEGALAPGGPAGLPRQFIGRRANDPYRHIALEQIAQGTVGLETRRQVSAGLARRLVTDGVTDATTGFVDRAGRRWGLDRYAAMAVRTTTREAATRATATRLAEGGQDLVTISEHAHPADECTPFEGNTYSLSGNTAGYEVLEEAPPFHPNCVHVMYPAADSLEAFELELEAAAHGALSPPASSTRPRPPATPPEAPSAAQEAATATYNRGPNPPRGLVDTDVPADPPFSSSAHPHHDDRTTARLEAQRIARAIAGAPEPDGSFDAMIEAEVKAAAAVTRKANRAINEALGPDLAKYIDRAWGQKARVRERLLAGEITPEEAEQEAYAEYREREDRRAQREGVRDLNHGLEHRPFPCFSCGRLKSRPADICARCGDDPVATSSGTRATSSERARFNADYGYAHVDSGQERSYGAGGKARSS